MTAVASPEVAGPPGVRTPMLPVLQGMHEQWLQEVRSVLDPARGESAGIWLRWRAVDYLETGFRRRFERERRVPIGLLYACGVVGFVVNIVAVLFIFVGPWYPPGFPTLAEWNTWMIGFTAVSVISGIVIYVISQSARRGKTDEELIAEGVAGQEIAEGTSSA